MSKELVSEIVVLVTGINEVIGRLTRIDGDGIVLESPRAFIATQEGMGFAPTISMCAEDDIKEATFNPNSVLCVVKAKREVADAWRQSVIGLVTSTKL